jgi:L,D-transpeptidase YcbB
MIVVNLPEFVLRAYEVQRRPPRRAHADEGHRRPALDTRTPLFDEDMRFIEFSPYWNVPPSIARNELVPRLRRDPAHFTREGFEFVGAGRPRGRPRCSAAKLDAVLAGGCASASARGRSNALGDIKFVFPNRDNIYLHHTPARLFDASGATSATAASASSSRWRWRASCCRASPAGTRRASARRWPPASPRRALASRCRC